MTTTEQLRAAHSDSWNWQRNWTTVLSANEWVIVPEDDETREAGPMILPMGYALHLLLDQFGAERLHQMIDEVR